MSDARELARRVLGLTAGVGAALAALVTPWSPPDALGLLAGSAVGLANFAGLHWGAGRALQATGSAAGPAGSGAGRRVLWIVASGARLALVALAVGTLAASGGVGLAGLLGSLTIVPLMVLVAGLPLTRAE